MKNNKTKEEHSVFYLISIDQTNVWVLFIAKQNYRT